MGKVEKRPKTFEKMHFWAHKSQNYEKSYKIKVKIRTILHTISKAQIHYLLVVGAIVLLK